MLKRNFIISVVVYVKNNEEYLAECIESVINQSLDFKENIQLILINDESADNSEKICLEYKEQYPQNIVYIKNNNCGINNSRRIAIKSTLGTYINFLNAKDKWGKNALKIGCEMLEEHKEINFCIFKRKDLCINSSNINKGENNIENEIVDINNETTSRSNIQKGIDSIIFRLSSIKEESFSYKIQYYNDLLLVNSLLIDNSKYGHINQEYYFSRNNETNNIGEKNKEYYNVLREIFINLIDKVKKEYGVLNKYWQKLCVEELQLRFKNNHIKILNSEEKNNYINDFRYILKNIDDNIIFSNKKININDKLAYLHFKYNKKINSKIDVINSKLCIEEEIVDSFNKIKNNIYEFEIDNGRLHIIGDVNFLIDFKLYYKYGKEDFKELKLYKKNNLDEYLGYKLNRLGYDVYIPLNESSYIEFYIEFNGNKYKLKNDTMHCSKLHTFRYSHYFKQGYMFYHKKNLTKIFIKKNAYLKNIAYELLYLKFILINKKLPKVFFTRLLYWITKPFVRKNILLFSDREFMAGDSGEVIFKYFNMQNKEKKNKTYFVINNKYGDYKRMKKYGRVIGYNTFRYKLIFLHSKAIISSHWDNYVNNAFLELRKYFVDLYGFKYIYLTHGVLLHDSSDWANRIYKNFSLCITSSPMEYESIINGYYYFEKNQLIKTGAPRFDNLMNLNVEQENKILFMPSWRNLLAGEVIKGTQRRKYNPLFKESEYFNFYNKLLNDEKLLSLLREKNIKIKFCIHPSFRAQANDFTGNDVVEYAVDVNSQYETLSSKLLVTDYSSAACDFAYINKPVIYANFDFDHIYEVHYYHKGYFDYDKHGFGPNCKSYNETLDAIVHYINNNFKTEEKYKERMDKFFFYKDNKNSERVYEEILKIIDEF